MFAITTYPSPVGLMTLASAGDKLVGAWLAGQKYFGSTILQSEPVTRDTPALCAAKAWLDRYFAAAQPAITELPLAPIGSPFRQAVWRILCEIPYGTVVTYGDIAQKIAADSKRPSMSSQAVGGAVGHNPISIIIPCHRVVGVDGSLTGYAGGIATKAALLTLEGADVPALRSTDLSAHGGCHHV